MDNSARNITDNTCIMHEFCMYNLTMGQHRHHSYKTYWNLVKY